MEHKEKKMIIANPIYDVVFKYMLDDEKVARLFLSALLGKEVLSLTFMPHEIISDRKRGKRSIFRDDFAHGLSIYRLDFSAKVRLPNGNEQLIIIELQKSKVRTSTGRFRTYLGKQYMKTDFIRWVANNQPRDYGAGIPIFPIFILGEGLDGFEGVPVIKISNCISDQHNGERLSRDSVFISSLFHEGLVINVPSLKERRRNDVEKLLSVFDQSASIDEKAHIMNIDDEDVEERYRPIIRRLQKAAVSEDMRMQMDGEDEIIREINDYEYDIAVERKIKEAALKEKEAAVKDKEYAMRAKEEAVQEKEHAMKEKEHAMQEKEHAMKEKERALNEAMALQQRLAESVRALKMAGLPISEIASITGLSEGEISLLH